MLVSPQLASCVDEYICRKGVHVSLKLKYSSLHFMQVYGQNSNAQYPGIRETSDILRRVKANESTIPLVDFISRTRNNPGVWKGVVG